MLWLGLTGSAAAGLASHEILVLVNRQSPRSMEIANHFVHLRNVPATHVIYLDLPDTVLEPAAEMSPEDFTRLIWEPTIATMTERELHDQILAWVYSTDFPVRITSQPPVSLQGITFLRNRLPDTSEAIAQAQYVSPLFSGPDEPDGRKVEGGSLFRLREALGDAMPLPSMMLGFAGARGNTIDEILRALRYGQVADHASPRGTVYWISGDDVRARMRNWQFPIAQAELQRQRIRSDISDEAPLDLAGIIGLQMGQAVVRAHQAGTFLPGSMAEHVTSHSAEFHLPIQTKATDWIRAGATATAGAVTEPFALWPKFPHARFFAHYARGHTILESFYLALRSPTQLLLLGEPLARPWAPRLSLTLIALDDEPLRDTASFMAAVFPEADARQLIYEIVSNGKTVSASAATPSFSFDTKELADGYHELRMLARRPGIRAHTVMGRRSIHVDNAGRQVALKPVAEDFPREWPADQPMMLNVEATGEPDRLELVHHHRVLAAAEGARAVFTLDPMDTGAGPVQVQARARFGDEDPVYSAPLRITIARPVPAPSLLKRRAEMSDWPLRDWPIDAASPAGGSWSNPEPDRLVLRPDADSTAWASINYTSTPLHYFSAKLTIPGNPHGQANQELAGLIYGGQNNDPFRFFGLHGTPSAWSFGTFHRGRLNHQLQRGAPLRPGTVQHVELFFDADHTHAYVNGQFIARHAHEAPPSATGIGLFAGGRPAQFESIRFAVAPTEEHE